MYICIYKQLVMKQHQGRNQTHVITKPRKDADPHCLSSAHGKHNVQKQQAWQTSDKPHKCQEITYQNETRRADR